MRHVTGAVLAGAALLVAGGARAQSGVLDRVTITGSTSVPTDKLMGAIQEHKGSRVAKEDIVADRDAIMKVLQDSHVTGNVGARITTLSNKHLSVEFVVHDEGVQAPTVTKVAPKLHEQIFVGNASIPTDRLAAASGIKAGDDLSNEKIVAAQQAILAAYKTAKLPVSVTINFADKKVSATELDVTWTIVETKAKKKRDTEDEGGQRVQ